MCTMLSLIAAEELQISRSRLLRFLEGYIGMFFLSVVGFSLTRLICAEILIRLRLYVPAAYLRKNAPMDEIRNMTGVRYDVQEPPYPLTHR